MNISHKSVLITGANRVSAGALLDDALLTRSKKSISGTRALYNILMNA